VHLKRIISGIQPSNKLTLGNYLGAIKQFVDLQNKYEMYIFVADLHALSGNFTPASLHENKKSLVATYAALGLNLSKNIIFYQSAVPAHTQLS
jgi:tryptophanyl-tRNA synthetase